MFMRREFDLNSVDMFADSADVYTNPLTEVSRKTMVSQEIVFQNQSGSTHSGRQQEFLEECQGVFNKLQRRPLGHVDRPDNWKLSPSIGDKKKRKQSGKRTWFDLNVSCDVIDLEDSTETMSNDDLVHEHSSCFPALPVDSRSKHESQKSVVTDPVLDDHERTSFYRDFDLNVLSEDLSSEKQQMSSYAMLDLDLNKVYYDDSSCRLNDPTITHPSSTSSSHASHGHAGPVDEGNSQTKFWTKECNNFSDEASGIGHPDDAQNLLPVSSKGNYEISKELCSNDKVLGPKENENVQTHTCPATKEANHEKRESEDLVITHLDHSESTAQEGYSSLVKACHVGDSESSNERTMKSEVELGNHVCVDRSSGSSKSDKFDVSIREAAESLVHIAFESSDCYEENKESSVDSFELFTLGIKECTEDNLCVTSKPFDVEIGENKDCGLKIRRGRRLKDFQRDILPGLASLSRHEIREDINILEGVLRSREYRKMQAKMADDGHSWCVPTRSRRSRLNCSQRGRFS